MGGSGKREQILRAAECLFTRKRFHEVTLDAVCGKARVGKGTIYRHFKDKDDLFAQLALSGFDDLCRTLDAQAAAAPLEERLRAIIEASQQFFRRHRPLFRMMHSEQARMALDRADVRRQWRRRRREIVRRVAAVLQDGRESGEIREDIPPAVLAAGLLGMLRGIAYHDKTVSASSDPASATINIFLKGARATSAPQERKKT